MTDTFTIEQITEAWSNSAYKGDIKELIAILTRTHWKRQVGEVVFNEADQKYHQWYSTSNNSNCCRALTTDEVPAWKRDKEALKVAMEVLIIVETKGYDGKSHAAKLALTKIKELTGE